MEIASELDKPVVIHSRDADEETIEILNKLGPKLKRKGVIHSFTSGPGLAKKAIEHDFYLGFNGIITFNSANEVRDIVSLCPLEKIILETDSPFLTPVPYRGRENAPFYLPFVAEKIAEIKNVSIEEVLKVTYQNSLDLFF
jgi:TatD DNase family protein